VHNFAGVFEKEVDNNTRPQQLMNPAPALVDSNVVHFNPEERIAALEVENRELRLKNEALEAENQNLITSKNNLEDQNGDLRIKNISLVQQNHCQGMFILYLAKRFFSSDDKARWYAGKSGKPVDEKRAHWHWSRNGGREKFESDFPTYMHVIKFFARTPKLQARIRKLLHTV
jgi:hypothetical protein